MTDHTVCISTLTQRNQAPSLRQLGLHAMGGVIAHDCEHEHRLMSDIGEPSSSIRLCGAGVRKLMGQWLYPLHLQKQMEHGRY